MRNEKRKKRIEKRNQEEGREEEQEEEIRRGLSNRKYVSSCIIQDTSHILLIIHLLFTDGFRMQDAGFRRRQLRIIENLNRNIRVKKDEYET